MLDADELYKRFSDKAREAFRTGNSLEKFSKKPMSSTHILMGLITSPSHCIVSILKHFGVSIAKAESDINKSSIPSDEVQKCHDIVLSAINSSKLIAS